MTQNKPWPTRPLAEIAHKVMVGIASAATHAYRPSGVVLLRNQNIREGKIDDSDILFIDPEYETAHKNKRLKKGDVITVRTGYPGISAVVPEKYDGAQCFTSLITRPNTEIIASEFLCLYINSSFGKRFILGAEAGGAQKNVNASTLEELEVPLPALSEQKKIAEILSTWDRGTEAAQESASALNKYGQHLIESLVASTSRITDRIALKDLVDVNPRSVRLNDESAVTFLGMADISETGQILSRRDRPYSEVRKGFTCFQENDTLIAKITPCFENGKGCLATGLTNKVGFGSTEFHVLRPKSEVDPRFPYYLSLSRTFRQKGTSFMTGSAGQRRVPTEFIEEYLVHDCRKSNQKVTLDLLDRTFQSSGAYERLAMHLKAQKQGLMQQLLTGKVRVKV